MQYEWKVLWREHVKRSRYDESRMGVKGAVSEKRVRARVSAWHKDHICGQRRQAPEGCVRGTSSFSPGVDGQCTHVRGVDRGRD